jgi:hypothetical protein
VLAKGLREQQSSFVNLTLGPGCDDGTRRRRPVQLPAVSSRPRGKLGFDRSPAGGVGGVHRGVASGEFRSGVRFKVWFGCCTSIVLEIGVFSSGRVVRSGDELRLRRAALRLL